jgi:hypothetical protein
MSVSLQFGQKTTTGLAWGKISANYGLGGWIARARWASAKQRVQVLGGRTGLRGLSLASADGGRAWGVELGVSTVLKGPLEEWARRTAFTVTIHRSGERSVTYVSKFCKPLDLKQSDYLPEGTFCQYFKSRRLAQPSLDEAVWHYL